MNLKEGRTQQLLARAVLAGMEAVRFSIGGHLPDDPEIKDDKTLVTVTDRRSEAAIVRGLREEFGDNIRIIGEEGEDSGNGELALLIDPLDGTRAFSSGMSSSTVILAVYDTAKKAVVGCIIGEVSTGRIWLAFNEGRSFIGSPMDTIAVWPGPLNEQSTVFMDVPHGFTRKGRQILTHEQMAKLFAQMNGKVKLAIPGSNGLIQALVANGGQKVAGSITTAIGGPWDVCGVKLVLNAGGSARAFSVRRVAGGNCILIDRNPLDVMSYDILICGNTVDTVRDLTNWLEMSL